MKEIDLYGLLRAADAHLGLHSTVLTDAVAAGTLNLIAVSDAHHDLIGYVPAGVAVPVTDRVSFLAALDAGPQADPDAQGVPRRPLPTGQRERADCRVDARSEHSDRAGRIRAAMIRGALRRTLTAAVRGALREPHVRRIAERELALSRTGEVLARR